MNNTLIKAALSLLLVLALFASPASSQNPPPNADTEGAPDDPEMPNTVYFDQESGYERFKNAQKFEREGKIEKALLLYAELVETDPDLVVFSGTNTFKSIRSYIDQLISGNDPNASMAYKKLFSSIADSFYARALKTGDTSIYEKVAFNYPRTDSGLAASLYLGDYYLSLGNLRSASYFLQRHVLFSESPSADCFMKIKICSSLMGLPFSLKIPRTTLDSNVIYRGVSMKLEEALADLGRMADSSAVPNQWNYSIGGSINGSFTPNSNPMIDIRSWTYPGVKDKADSDAFAIPFTASVPLNQENGNVLLLPAVVDGTVFVNTGRNVAALDELTGDLVWQLTEDGPSLFPAYSSDDRNKQFVFGISARKDMIFANIARLNDANPSAIVAVNVDVAKKRIAWQSFSSNLNEGDVDGVSFISPPLALYDRVYAAAVSTVEPAIYSLFCFAADDGKLVWRKSIGEPESQFGSTTTSEFTVPMLVSDGNSLLLLSNYGIVANIDPMSGDFNWIYDYSESKADDMGMVVPFGRRGRIQNMPAGKANLSFPVITEGVAYCLPKDSSSFLILDLSSGKKTGSFIPPGGKDSSAVTFIGLRKISDEICAYFTTDRIVAISTKTSKQLFTSTQFGYVPTGRAVMTSECIYLPCIYTDKKISSKPFWTVLRFSPSCRFLDRMVKPHADDSSNGSLAVIGPMVLACSQDRISAFTDSESYKASVFGSSGKSITDRGGYSHAAYVQHTAVDSIMTLRGSLFSPLPFVFSFASGAKLLPLYMSYCKQKNWGSFIQDPSAHYQTASNFIQSRNVQGARNELELCLIANNLDDFRPSPQDISAYEAIFNISIYKAFSSSYEHPDRATQEVMDSLQFAASASQKATAYLAMGYINRTFNPQLALQSYSVILSDEELSGSSVYDYTSQIVETEGDGSEQCRSTAGAIALSKISMIADMADSYGIKVEDTLRYVNGAFSASELSLSYASPADEVVRVVSRFPFDGAAAEFLRKRCILACKSDSPDAPAFAKAYGRLFTRDTEYFRVLRDLTDYYIRNGRQDMAVETLSAISAFFSGREVFLDDYSVIVDKFVASTVQSCLVRQDAQHKMDSTGPVIRIPKSTDGDDSKVVDIFSPSGYVFASPDNLILLSTKDSRNNSSIRCVNIPEGRTLWQESDDSGLLGIIVNEQDEGSGKSSVLIDSFMAGFPCHGLERGDLIISVNSRAVDSLKDCLDSLIGVSDGDDVPLVVDRAGVKHQFVVKAGSRAEADLVKTSASFAGFTSSGDLMIAYPSGLKVVDKNTGSLKWRAYAPDSSYALRYVYFMDGKSLIVFDSLSKAPPYGSVILSLDDVDGRLLWERKVPDKARISVGYPHLDRAVIEYLAGGSFVVPRFQIVDASSGVEISIIYDGTLPAEFGASLLLLNQSNPIPKVYDITLPSADSRINFVKGPPKPITNYKQSLSRNLIFSRNTKDSVNVYAFKDQMLKEIATLAVPEQAFIADPYDGLVTLETTSNLTRVRYFDSTIPAEPAVGMVPDTGYSINNVFFIADKIILLNTERLYSLDKSTMKLSGSVDFESTTPKPDVQIDVQHRLIFIDTNDEFVLYTF